MESPGAFVDDEFHSTIFAWFICSFGPPSHVMAYRLERGGMPLHDTFGVNCETGATTDIKSQVPIVYGHVSVYQTTSHDCTASHDWREKVMAHYYYYLVVQVVSNRVV